MPLLPTAKAKQIAIIACTRTLPTTLKTMVGAEEHLGTILYHQA